MNLPSGTVTFLFTDIEGSTKLWEEHPEAMRSALDRHDALLRSAIESNNGHVFKTIGDAFCAAFPTAPDALSAALAAQRDLHAELWQDGLSLRVRMALHTGAAEMRDNDYFGQPLNRVARLLAAGHGEQVLLSDVAHDLSRDTLPPSTSLKSLGEHRLRDLGRPEHVYQLLHPDLPSEFPPLRSLDNPALPNNLPQQVTSFIGRETEIAAVKSLLAKTHLLTLTGSGGCGKSRLTLQVAAEVLEDYPDGAWLVEFAPLSDSTLVPQTVATVLGVKEEASKPRMLTLVDFLKTKRLLLLLDNCEHLLSACAQLADAVIRTCPHVKILASSREGLGFAGEQTYLVPSLSLPPQPTHATPQSLSQYEAVRLFIERAMSVQSTFAVTNANAPALAQLCVQLDGIPLALELAAARVRSLAVEEINSKLDNRFRLLTGGSRTALPRQQTLRALMDWSYDLLNDQEKALFCRLSVFAGGWTLQAAEQICAGEDNGEAIGEPIEEWEVLDLLTSLVDKSLVVAEQEEGQTRYRLLETVRQYARERLVERGEVEIVRERHQVFFVALAEAAEPHLRGPEQSDWLHRLETEHDNLRAALEGNNQKAALRIASVLWWFWYVRGYFYEGRGWLARVLAEANAQAHIPTRAKALLGAGVLAYSQGDYAEARRLYEESLALRRELGDKQNIAASLNNLAVLAYEQGDYAEARTLHEESLALRRELGDKQSIAASLNNLGLVAHLQDDYKAARTFQEESLGLFREVGDKHGIAYSLFNLGNVSYAQGDNAEARPLLEESLGLRREMGDKAGMAYSLMGLGCVALTQGDNAAARTIQEESLALFREVEDKRGIAYSLHNLGNVVCAQEDYTTARSFLKESLALFRELGQQQGIAGSLEAFAALASVQKQAQRATRLWGAAEALREEIGTPLPPSQRVKYEGLVSETRADMNENAFAAAWAEGRAMTMEQAIEYAMEEE